MLVKLMSNVMQALEPEVNLSEPSCFTDSKVVLFWIQGRKEWKQFVQNRVNEIRELLPVGVWKHCCGADNPADLPSRGVSVVELTCNPVWLKGPIWLSESQGIIPDMDEEEPPEECLKEMKCKGDHTTHLVHSLLLDNKSTSEAVIKCEDFSTLDRLLRVTAHVIKFLETLKARSRHLDTTTEKSLTGADLEKAELYWIKLVQYSLQGDKRFSMWKQQFGLFLDESGVWRCGGRLSYADLPQVSKHPILLDATHHFATLVVVKCHDRVMHNGVSETLNELRSKYWIVRGRSFVKKILHKCLLCKRMEGQHYRTKPSPPLPQYRVRQAHPFSSCGLDYAGPLYTRDTNKVWICLFTCCATRAIHLELVQDMTAKAFLLCFKRFTARRGVPSRVVHDNSQTFKSGNRLIVEILDCSEVIEYFSGMHVQWEYNLEKAPWWGGMFERMIQSMKRCLKKAIGRARLSHDELFTAVTQVEAMLNSRPLTYLSSEELEEAVTPSHLLVGYRLLCLPDIQGDVSDPDFGEAQSHASINQRLEHLKMVLEHFWKRWRREYLQDLRDRHRYSNHLQGSGEIKVGDVVVVHSDKYPRTFWKIGVIEQLLSGGDG